jgi:1-phosphatidylinositol-3-phosphate 5-kinase
MGSSAAQENDSPSASPIFLPLGRRSRRGSMASLSTQVDKETLTQTLDQIHTQACQSEALTVFNEYTNPPSASSVTEKPGIAGDIQGGISGLYSRLRASVGGVGVMVGGTAKAGDNIAADDGSLKNSNPGTPSTKPTISQPKVTPIDVSRSMTSSTQPSRIQSPVGMVFTNANIDGANLQKSSKSSSKPTSISSKASVPPTPILKSPITPLSKVTTSFTTDPVVAEVNVNAVKDNTTHVKDTSGNASMGLPGKRPSDLSLDKSYPGIHQSLSHGASELSPDLYKGQQSLTQSGVSSPVDASRDHRQTSDSARPSRSLNDLVAFDNERTGKRDSSASNQAKAFDLEAVSASNSRKPSSLDDVGVSTNKILISHAEKSHMPDGATQVKPTKVDLPRLATTDIATKQANIQSSTLTGSDKDHSSNPSAADRPPKPAKITPRISQSRLPGFRLSRASSSDNSASVAGTTTTSVASHIKFNQDLDGAGDLPIASRTVNRDGESQPPPHVLSQIRSKVLSKDFWMRDQNAKDCFNCGEPFSTFRRKHHCREFHYELAAYCY